MLKLTSSKGQEVHIAPSAIKEVVIYRAQNKAAVYTDNNVYETDVKTAEVLISDSQDRSLSHLTTAINRLTEMIRARVR